MTKLSYFDYYKSAQEKGIHPKELRSLEKEIRHEFPNDRMMFELHMLRAVSSWNDWHTGKLGSLPVHH
ncbi:MAG: hypothetical protein HY401_00850 [Elusimicrobia bacterium]|nr:hypothetical protein [Elusimicrobiota bacterium]